MRNDRTIREHGARPRPRHVLLIMVDGLGIPADGFDNSVYRQCPTLRELMQRHAAALDATLGVAGLPQSATGQTALFTGVNAAELLGRHVQGFPTAELRRVIERENIFRKLLDHGRTCTFANAYARAPEHALPKSLRSVTTVAAFAAFGRPRDRQDMLAGRAVYHDLTRTYLHEHDRTDDSPLISEAEAAAHLLHVLRTVDFCLFEFFLTDHVGHRGTDRDRHRVLASLDAFLDGLLNQLDPDHELLLLVSDHGNIEAPGTRHHTMNPVPFCAWGSGAAAALRGMDSITQVTPRILALLGICRTDRHEGSDTDKNTGRRKT